MTWLMKDGHGSRLVRILTWCRIDKELCIELWSESYTESAAVRVQGNTSYPTGHG
jgi:hypothetical protein